MKRIYNSLLLLGLIFIGFGCTDDFEEMNTPKDSVTEVEPRFFFSDMVQGVFANYQRNVNLYPDFYAQYWASTGAWAVSDRYEYKDDWIGNQWKEHYTQFNLESNTVDAQFGDKPAYNDQIAIKNIWMVYWWSRMTDTYGDIPYFGVSNAETNAYDSQEAIYDDLFLKLDEAIKSIKNDETQALYGEYDLVYKGDVAKWIRFGNSLRLRLAMRISNIAPAKAQAEAQAAIAGGVMTSNDDIAHVPMWSNGWYDYLHQMAWYWDNIRVAKTFTNYLYGQSSVGEDPRAPRWLSYKVDGKPLTKEAAGKATYEGLENGLDASMPSSSAEVTGKATIRLENGFVEFSGDGDKNAMFCPVMYYSEVLFLQAEAALRGWTSGNANALYKQAVEASMDFVGVNAVDGDAYVAGLNDLTGSNEAQLKQIITQKWIANFPNGIESWADFRRTDYPDLTLPYDGVSGNASVAADTYVKRVRYPDNQHNLNEVSMPSALNTIETDRMDIKLWWDVENTKAKSGGLMNSNF
ncbi:SusD/RagB family nutrient-binding outer membrane lipoprotein [Labilibaculum sp. A4]|uniref:SusD/RagB family nutrient-binding outer membrane lipoprotein n=1 Tax=Labilibaculum euxinus TaxID=2686357 RepID=UPI0013661554|nr:SusD/RagB family nutrient-binding outer membrane lipoprotein [Labilibaculum euxinus]MDQ1771409.1 SusD/RagB family nutrient-binding outer membrane lipoprotein [Labilibaculum euxinus]MWN76703.1 SusD/RagB family nutrient-binding outer membrane lipoprotein [Labilibaculum euxinus]